MSSFNARLIEKDIFTAIIAANNGSSEIVDLNGASKFSCQAIYDVQAPSAKTFDSPQFAILTNQAVTYTAQAAGAAGNSITIHLIVPGVDGALSIAVVGTAISVTLARAAGLVTTTASSLVTAVNANGPANALVQASGAGAGALIALATTHLAGGSDGEVDVLDNTISIPSHGLPTGLKIRLTTTGTLPAPFLVATDYFVIVVDVDTIQLAASLSDALAGTAIVLVDEGADGSVNTVTAVALSGASITFKRSNDRVNWETIQTATTITVDGSVLLVQPNVSYRYFKAVKALTAGVVAIQALVLVIGDPI